MEKGAQKTDTGLEWKQEEEKQCEISFTNKRDMQTGKEKRETVKKIIQPLFSFSHFISPSTVRSYDLLTGDIMETTAIFIGW